MSAVAPSLQRTTFETSRLLEFFTEKELTMQIGHDQRLWPLALVKELVDNALDACDLAGIAPKIIVTVEPDAVSVLDNGPGLPERTLERSLDYLVRVSDKAFYVSPTRGQLGNALKCVWAAPYVVDGEHGRVEVRTAGRCHVIDVTLDRIAQEPVLDHTMHEDGIVKTGTLVTLHWPEIASLLATYAMVNPHATFTLRLRDREHTWDCTDAGWTKWRPDTPTSPHWYSIERLRDLIAAYISEERRSDRPAPRTVREFIAEFNGLSGSLKPKAVAEAAGLARARLTDLVVGGDVDLGKVTVLLRAMQAAARPVKPAALGLIGETHITQRLIAHWGVEPESIRYKKTLDLDDDGTPFALETAFGILRDGCEGLGRRIVAGVNWSASIRLPFARMPFLMTEARADAHDLIVLVAHLAQPSARFTDRGKGVLGHV